MSFLGIFHCDSPVSQSHARSLGIDAGERISAPLADDGQTAVVRLRNPPDVTQSESLYSGSSGLGRRISYNSPMYRIPDALVKVGFDTMFSEGCILQADHGAVKERGRAVASLPQKLICMV